MKRTAPSGVILNVRGAAYRRRMHATPYVDAPPATQWAQPRPTELNPQLWATHRPTDETFATLELPAGTVIRRHDGSPLAWMSAVGQEGLAELWLRCAKQFPETGLWPVLNDRRWLKEDPEPFDTNRGWEFLGNNGKPYWRAPYAVPDDVYDAFNLPDRENYFGDPDWLPVSFHNRMNEIDLRVTDMELADASSIPTDALARLTTPRNAEQLTLVACRRPADSVLILDFGVANGDATLGIFCGVLRSWETRFGVVPVMLQPAWTAFQVLAPPTDDLTIDRLAAEIYSFAQDSAIQGGFYTAPDTRVTERQLAQSHSWLIWWD